MEKINVQAFDYNLPEERIAKFPPKMRGSTRLIQLNRETGKITHGFYSELDQALQPGDLVLLNNSKVIKARLYAQKPTGANVELLLLEKHGADQDVVMYGGKLKKGQALLVQDERILVEEILGNGLARISSEKPLLEILEQYGNMPIPPYLNRKAVEEDVHRYQTVFASEQGSVAAPTASLNFTDELLERLQQKGIRVGYLTLHVGLGTFMPIRAEHLEDHTMHREFYHIPKETVELIQATKKEGRRLLAVGTTVTRALEHAGAEVILNVSPENIINEADIFIYPGYEFKVVDMLLTNFHAPRSTVLMLAAAFASWDLLKKGYEEALEKNYKFLSYGDSMLVV